MTSKHIDRSDYIAWMKYESAWLQANAYEDMPDNRELKLCRLCPNVLFEEDQEYCEECRITILDNDDGTIGETLAGLLELIRHPSKQ